MKITKIIISIMIVILMLIGNVTPVLAEAFVSETTSQVCDGGECYTFSLSNQEVKEIDEVKEFKAGFKTIMTAFMILFIYLGCLKVFYDIFNCLCLFSNGTSIFCSITVSAAISFLLGIIIM